MVMEEAKTRSPRMFALLLLGVTLVALTVPCPGQDHPPAPATLSKLFTESETAFGARDYKTTAAKLTELLKLCDNKPEYPLEFLMFSLGLANLLDDQAVEAERAFDACAQKFPQGEYTSRCYLGIGTAAIAQGGDEKKKVAIEALQKAAADVRYRTEAGLKLGQVYIDSNQTAQALTVFRGLMGADVRTPQQTSAAEQIAGLLAAEGSVEDLAAYLDYLRTQPGVRDSIAWFSNQVTVKGDNTIQDADPEDGAKWAAALELYRSVPPRAQILKIQAVSLDDQRKELDILKKRQEAEATDADDRLSKRSNVAELIASAEDAIKLKEAAKSAIEGMKDLDASLLMRRGRCLFYLTRREEALACFSTIREKYPDAQVAQAAAYAEIVIYNELGDFDKILRLGDFMEKYPDAPNIEMVTALIGEVLVKKGDWAKVQSFYEDAAKRFPQSTMLDRFKFYIAVAVFQQGEFEQAAELFDQWLEEFPNAPQEMKENAEYRLKMAKLLSK